MRAFQRAKRTGRALVDSIFVPPHFPQGHFYSPTTSQQDVKRALSWSPDTAGVDLCEGDQLALFQELLPLFEGVSNRRYKPNNNWYDSGDALLYQAFVRRLKPKRVIEVGSGFSTAKLLDTTDLFLPSLKLTCIEPNPERLLSLLKNGDRDSVEIIASPVQDVPLELLTSLEDGDVLFIDSTHVGKAGSDVLWLYLHVLPRLKRGVAVHIHDIFWPFEYPAQWLNEGRDWNEVYFLNAFLCHNEAWRIELFSSWLWQTHSELVPPYLRKEKPGSIWLKRC